MHSEFSTSSLSDALVILGAAGIVIPAFARLRISPVIGFILVGLLFGPAGLGRMAGDVPVLNYLTISNPETVEPFAEFGIVLLLFSIGLELSFRRLWSMRRLVFGVGAAQLLLAAVLIGVGLNLLGQSVSGSVALGLALALSSTALVLPLVNTESPVGRAALAMLLFEDLAIVPIVFLTGALAPNSEGEIDGLLTTLALGAATIAAMLVLGRFFLPRLFAQAARTKSPEIFLSISLLVVIVASLATSAVGLSPIMGALLAGILIAETDYHSEVEVITAPFRGLALGVFLITVGMSVDMSVVAANWLELLIGVIAVLLLKALVTGLLLRLNGASKSVAAEGGMVMASPSETTLIVLAAATTAQLIEPGTAAFWQIVTAIGLTITPLLSLLGRFTARQVNDGSPEAMPERKLDDRPPVVIIGYGRVGRMVADMLGAHARAYVAVDANVDQVMESRRKGVPIIFGDVSRPELLERLDLQHAGALVLTMDDPVLTVRLTRKVREAFPALSIIARARDERHAAELYRAGATEAVPETLESSLQLSEAVLVELGTAMGPVIASIHNKRAEARQEIMELGQMTREPALQRRRLRDAAQS